MKVTENKCRIGIRIHVTAPQIRIRIKKNVTDPEHEIRISAVYPMSTEQRRGTGYNDGVQ
jgi:hypothetical protein